MFDVDDILILQTPHAPEHQVEVSYRGKYDLGRSVVYNPKSGWQGVVNDEWLRRKEDPNTLIEYRVRVEWQELGEGLSGEYNEEDPNDVELLRFYVSLQDDDGNWQDVEDASYCTNFPVSATPEQRQAGLRLIMDKVYEGVIYGASIKKVCEELSWIDPSWIEGSEANA